MAICPKCEREIRHAKQWHNCVTVSIDDLFTGRPDELLLLFDKLLSTIADWSDVSVSATANCIVFVHRQTFLIIRPMKMQLDLKFYSQQEITEPPVMKSIAYTGKFVNRIRISSSDDVSPVLLRYLKDSYRFL